MVELVRTGRTPDELPNRCQSSLAALQLMIGGTGMGKTKGPYEPEFPVGTQVRILELEALEKFQQEWKWHNPLRDEQLSFAGREAQVNSVAFYHGGDELYELKGVPGIWHEACLTPGGAAVGIRSTTS